MKKVFGSILLLLFIGTNWASAQCINGMTSPEPSCITTLPNGDVEVYFELASMGVLPTPSQVAKFELYASNNLVFVGAPVATLNVPPAGPWPGLKLTHTGANAGNVDWYYQIVATCTGPPSAPLPLPATRNVIRSIRLKADVTNDFNVNLAWNWDSITQPGGSVGLVTVQRKKPTSAPTWNFNADYTLQTQNMFHVDTVISCRDSMLYRIRIPKSSCTSVSNEIRADVEDKTPPNKPKIDTVSFDPVKNKPLIRWNVNPAEDTRGYVVLFYPSGDCGTGILVDTVIGRTNNKIIDLNNYNGTTSGQYSVYAFDNCVPGDYSVSPRSECVKSIQLTPSLDICQKSVMLDWTAYNGFASGTDVLYKIFVSVSGSAFIFVDQTTSLFYLHEDPIEKNILTYKIVAVENGGAGPKTTSSNRVKVDAEFLKYPEYAYLRYATVEDENYVRLELFQDVNNDVSTYVLKRALDTSDVYNTVNVFHAPDIKLPIDSIVLLSDRSPITDKHQYFYKVDMFDSCGSYMETSNVTSTMLLRGEVDNVRRVNVLEWTNVVGLYSGVDEYQVHRFLDGERLPFGGYDYRQVNMDSAYTTVFYDSLLVTQNSNSVINTPQQGKYTYYILAKENEPSFRGLPPAKLVTNEITLIQQPYISSPNAFTPNGDGKNENFKPVLTYSDVSNYEFYVMNRYGEMVYETQNSKASWDGTLNGKPVPAGVYVYSVTYRSSSGQQFEDRGTVTIVR